MALPILYSYRRCPYAMRARMALKLAGIDVEIREISLRDKPAHMLQVSPKATVPVLVLQDGTVIEQSLDIMHWALQQHALGANASASADTLILENDTAFKQALDAYKYPERYPSKTQIQHRADGEVFLQKLENLLLENIYLFSTTPSLADIAIFPFVRQFAAVDSAWFEAASYPKLQLWLSRLIESELFISVMEKQPTYIE
ncbi:glutathione S-transferase [Methylotenera versatilis]|uniref:Glutathione S-transferase domain protein n=1 Tax=Methylotenera versatilis (strain 301) TaxID=666681 RepID=D7DM30_METV0|nr:glutathione S-transferase [Methylotenera versatilis]ADI30724.1 Glutathione S-transferase domain protein [Methylotenera versatilis 301]